MLHTPRNRTAWPRAHARRVHTPSTVDMGSHACTALCGVHTSAAGVCPHKSPPTHHTTPHLHRLRVHTLFTVILPARHSTRHEWTLQGMVRPVTWRSRQRCGRGTPTRRTDLAHTPPRGEPSRPGMQLRLPARLFATRHDSPTAAITETCENKPGPPRHRRASGACTHHATGRATRCSWPCRHRCAHPDAVQEAGVIGCLVLLRMTSLRPVGPSCPYGHMHVCACFTRCRARETPHPPPAGAMPPHGLGHLIAGTRGAAREARSPRRHAPCCMHAVMPPAPGSATRRGRSWWHRRQSGRAAGSRSRCRASAAAAG